MPMREVVNFGQCLSIVGTALTTSFQGGTAISLMGVEEIDFEIAAAFDAATTLTNQIFQVQVSDDATNWEPAAAVLASSGVAAATATLAAVAGQTVRDRLQFSSASVVTTREARYLRLAVKTTGASKSGDSATANLKFSM